MQSGVGGPKRRHHKLRQLCLCHVNGVPVYNHGRLDGRAVLGESDTKAVFLCLCGLVSARGIGAWSLFTVSVTSVPDECF